MLQYKISDSKTKTNKRTRDNGYKAINELISHSIVTMDGYGVEAVI